MRTKVYFGNFLDRSVSTFFGTTTLQLLEALSSPEDSAEVLMDALTSHDPKSNLVEYPDRYELSLLAPGVRKELIELSLNESGHLLVETKVDEVEAKEDAKTLRKGFVVKSFSEAYEMPKDANYDTAEAVLEDGVLTIIVKRMMPSKNTITIK